MFRWIVGRLTDILLAFALATVILGYGAYHYPEFFPRQFYHYWPVAVQPKSATQAAAPAPNTQMQEQN